MEGCLEGGKKCVSRLHLFFSLLEHVLGGGMLALPLVLARLGLATSLVIMLLTWLLTYYSSLISVELNLNSDHGLSLGLMGKNFSGKVAGFIGEVSVKLLSYALLSAFIYGASSIVQKLIEKYLGYIVPIFGVETFWLVLTVGILLFPVRVISRINNLAFLCFLAIFSILIVAMIGIVDCTQIPWFAEVHIKNVAEVITVVFTSFGYQVIFHTLRDYCGKDANILRKAFLWGSFIPTAVYMLWTGGVLGVVFKNNPGFFKQITGGGVNVGALIGELAMVSGFPGFQIFAWSMAILAIFTSILGVGIGLTESLSISLGGNVSDQLVRRFFASLGAILPAYIVAVVVPNAFTKILGFAGAILVVIAILLPAYLFKKSNITKLFLPELKKWLIFVCSIIGVFVMLSEFFANYL